MIIIKWRCLDIMHGYRMPTSHCLKSDKLSITVMKAEHKRKFGNLKNVKKKKKGTTE